jgi:acyl-CoA synthetase (NDP forming)
VTVEKLLERLKDPQAQALDEYQSKQVLKAYGVPTVDEIVAKDQTEAVSAAEKIGYPVVIKGLGQTLLHKTEENLVHLNLADESAVKNAAREITARAGEVLEGILVQPYISGQREFVAGLFRDPQFGPVVMFGLGGIFTEAFADVAFRLAPIDENEAQAMLSEISGKRLLDDFRGEKVVDRSQLTAVLMGLSRLGHAFAHIKEIDINPLKITADGRVLAVDGLIIPGPAASPATAQIPVDPRLLGSIFYPRSIAFVGASGQIGKWGNLLLTMAISGGYKGDIYLVNHKGGVIAGRSVYKSLAEISAEVDLAVITIPAAHVTGLIPQLKEKGITKAVVITSGFGETGPEGKLQEQKLVEAARKAGIILVGPNTMGLCNPHDDFYCTGSQAQPLAGGTAMISQSGNMGGQLLNFASQQDIGIRAFCGSGNEAMITIEDYLEAFEVDELTRTVMLYVESVKNGRRFFESARRLSRKKPIILLKGGRSAAGNKAAASHTGAMASDMRVFDAVCQQSGIVQVQHPMDMLDCAAAFSSLPLPRGKRVAIMTLGGGWGVVTSDLCAQHGLELPPLSENIVKRLDQMLPPYWSRDNPVDIVGENDFAIPLTAMEELMKWDGCDAVINLGIVGRRIMANRMMDSVLKVDPAYTAEFLDELRQALADFEQKYIHHLIELMEQYPKPILGVSLAGQDAKTVYRAQGKRHQAVFYATPERAVMALAKMVEYQCFQDHC